MANGIAPDTLPSHQRPRRRQWLGLAVVIVAVAVATVTVPPLITPHHEPRPAAPSSSSPQAAVIAATSPSPSPSAAAPTADVSPSARFVPITVEAEDLDNTLTGGAAPTECATCRGGARVRYLCVSCQVVVRATVPVAGKRTITVVYESDGYRALKVKVNNDPARTFQVGGTDWTTPRSFRFTAELPAGPVRVSLFNDDTPAPDVDQVVIS
ncbi:hypothetical protein Ais01nite_43410 [Asanoa ishikariensis]|uniref:CBM6 domain-containing protein n=1 Tax=Asanoa ishikariensis TaxID=137265 RepID=A0A1H3MRS7_9ACTN|nr:hypothetical protein [Asanoa ishikariensis]GIF66306.1 hypothetical protein Ais01nite_43410 [Asanoa ishikariensis]SDY79422.1 hypothetical protein SAMN05421684_1583 [Asanoa ishikariensis]